MTMAAPEAPTINPMNPLLYSLLEHKFSSVLIANAGASAQVQRFKDPLRPGKFIKRAQSWGEYYRVCCPFCKEDRHRLWINHTYGADFIDGRRMDTHLAVCYNDGCLKQEGRLEQLADLIFGGGRQFQTKAVIRPPTSDYVLKDIEPPGEIVRIDTLPDYHPAVEYLAARNFDIKELAERFDIGVCTTPALDAYKLMRGRIYIPAYADSKLVAWQGRIVGNRTMTVKYFTQGRKSQMLYNYDAAREQPVVILVEGAPSVWRMWPAAVCCFGKSLSLWQETALATTWADKPIFIVLDNDAQDELEKTTQRLCDRNMSVVPVILPDVRDPADYTRAELFDLLSAAADAVDVKADLSFLQ